MRIVSITAAIVACWPAGAAPIVVKSRFPSPDVIIAVSALRPPAAGLDASPAVQAAIDAAAHRGGGTVFLREGLYRLEKPITLKEGVTLRGETPLAGTLRDGTWARFNGQGTVLAPVHGRGSLDGPAAITMERGTGLTHLAVWYPDQRADAIVPYPWTVAGSTQVSGDNYTVRSVLFVNPYQAMRFGPEWNELHTIEDVRGTPLRAGIFVDTCTDIGRLTNIDFTPRYWETAALPGAPAGQAARTSLRTFLLQDGVGVEIGRSDWEYLYRVRVAGYGTAFRYRPGAQGTTNGVMYGCQAIAGRVGIDVIELNGIGLAATACRFEGSQAGVYTRPTYTAVVQLNDCDVRSTGGPALRLDGRGTTTVCGTRIAGARPAVEAVGGRFAALGTRFTGPAPQVRLERGVGVARLLGCSAHSASGRSARLTVDDRGSGDAVIDARPVALARPPSVDAQPAALPRPASSTVVDAARYGAVPGAADITRPLQKALQTAGTTGGTVYLAAGRYRMAGSVVVPTGVELRGSFDVPHHTQSGGTMLLATGGHGQEKGTPLIRLRRGSGVRGLTVWYPRQNLDQPVPYPWTVQGTGPRCWVTDFTIGNGWQGVDFWTHASTGHRVRYLAGGLFRRGLFVSKSEGGRVEDVQLNPHYMARLPAGLPRPAYAADPFGKVIDFQQARLEGLVFGRCSGEKILRTFLYAALDGLAFLNDGGGTSAVVVNHGTDAASRAVTFGAAAPGGIDLINTQLVVLGRSQVGAVVSTSGFKGEARLFNSQMWAPGTLASLSGPGRIVLQQFNNHTGPARIDAGSATFQAGLFAGNWQPAIRFAPASRGGAVVGCLQPRGLLVEGAPAQAVVRGNSRPPRIPAGPTTLASGFEAGEPQPDVDTPQDHQGGRRAVSALRAAPVPGTGRDGSTGFRFTGIADDPAHSYAYARLFAARVVVHPDTVLTYWMRPSNALSLKTGIDLVFADGSTLRDSGGQDSKGRGVHPGTDRGSAGAWEQIVVPLGHRAGEVITVVMAAFDGRPGGGPFETVFDDIRIERSGRRR